MATTFRIPKQTDREIIQALDRVRQSLAAQIKLKVQVHIPHQGGIQLPEDNFEKLAQIKFVLDSESQVISTFQLVLDGSGYEAFLVNRETENVTDKATLSDTWSNNATPEVRQKLPQLFVALLAATRAELKTIKVEAALKGSGDSAWNRYRDAQTAVVSSLQQATQTLIIQASQKNAELDKARAERFEKLETELRAQLDKERKELQASYDGRLESLRGQEKALADREASFNTKESHYVARQKQDEQIKQVQRWLDGWSLTKGTQQKRRPVFWLYVTVLATTAALTVFATWHSYDVLKSVDEIVKLAWWQWAAIWAKSFFPLAAFVTFTVYFIRWSGDWARQHSEEEFRNRTLLVDIGRSSWLLEAVRDSQERNKELPSDLLRELSRNLFATNSSQDKDIHPQAFSDVLLQGLSSVRIKSADGAEVEASRNRRK